MKPYAIILFLLLVEMAAWSRTEDFAERKEIDGFHFMAGICFSGVYGMIADPPMCESFFRAGGEQRVAELFIDAARHWSKRTGSRAATTYYYDPSGQRLEVINRDLAKKLTEFYAQRQRFTKREWAEREKSPWFVRQVRLTKADLTHLDRRERLSFVAGVYARCFRDGEFWSSPNIAMNATVDILRAEGCKVSRPRIIEAVPSAMHFKVKPSQDVKRLFTTVDEWKTPRISWKER